MTSLTLTKIIAILTICIFNFLYVYWKVNELPVHKSERTIVGFQTFVGYWLRFLFFTISTFIIILIVSFISNNLFINITLSILIILISFFPLWKFSTNFYEHRTRNYILLLLVMISSWIFLVVMILPESERKLSNSIGNTSIHEPEATTTSNQASQKSEENEKNTEVSSSRLTCETTNLADTYQQELSLRVLCETADQFPVFIFGIFSALLTTIIAVYLKSESS